VQRTSNLLWCTPPSSTFVESLISFNSSPFQVFQHLLGLGSFDSLEGLLACKWASLPKTFSGIMFISTFTIAPTTYLGSWALVVLVIIVRFMVNQHLFLLEALTWVNNNKFCFQQHLKATCDLSPPPARVFFSIWTIHRVTNDSTSRFHLEMPTPSYPFQHAFWRDIWGPSCPNFVMF